VAVRIPKIEVTGAKRSRPFYARLGYDDHQRKPGYQTGRSAHRIDPDDACLPINKYAMFAIVWLVTTLVVELCASTSYLDYRFTSSLSAA
jgi:hypothetical protein